MDNTRILVVDDDKEIAAAIGKLLRLEGYETSEAHTGKQALEYLGKDEYKLIIMDIMMPELDGLSATLRIRDKWNMPIIMLSAKSEDSDKILGLSIGADDYVTKPFNPQELLARVKSQLRRFTSLGVQGQNKNGTRVEVGGLELNTEAKELFVDGEAVRLTPTEYRIMELLMTNAGIVFSADQIYERVWEEQPYSVENTVMVHIRRIREKIEINPREPKYLKVVWGIGYKIEKL